MADVPTNTQEAAPAEAQNLATIVTEWRKIHEDIAKDKDRIKENKKRAGILESIIMNIMKQKNLGALDLKSSGGRILYEKKERKGGLGAKTLQKLLTEHMKDETKAAEAMKYLNEHRDARTLERLAYERA
jgi:hypothetical protein